MYQYQSDSRVTITALLCKTWKSLVYNQILMFILRCYPDLLGRLTVICDKVHQEYMAIVTIQTSLLSKPESISKTDGYKHATLRCMSHALQHKTNLTTKKTLQI